MKETLQIIELGVAILLMITILLQQRGAGLGSAFGGEGFSFKSRRGAEKFLFQSSVFVSVIFVGIAVAILLLARS